VAGSAGKTTTRSAIGALLSAMEAGGVHFVPGNLNNRVGVPSVLLGLGPEHRVSVLEIGTNAPGEVLELATLSAPDVSVLTLIGVEHSEGLGSIEQIEAEEASLFAALGANGIAIGNADDPRVARRLATARGARRLGYGFAESADYRVIERTLLVSGGSRLVIGRPGAPALTLECGLLGRAGAYALAAGIAAAEACVERPLSAEEAARGSVLLGAGEPGRLTSVFLLNGALLLDDSYNSNPASLVSSVHAALELARARGGRLKLVLGEMRELGERSPELHREAGEGIADVEAGLVLGVAGDARWLLEPFAGRGVPTRFSDDANGALGVLCESLEPNDVVLIKASRGVRVERIVEGLVARFGRVA
jgi:UDP-N-acetylmuramoyl-tripeptide--D-alanyl-D-alanine ligase